MKDIVLHVLGHLLAEQKEREKVKRKNILEVVITKKG